MTVTDSLPDVVAAAVAALADEQWRVARLVDRAASRDAWSVTLGPDQRLRLVRLGHFPVYSAELDWTPREVTGHLRDSAVVFADRIRRMRTEHDPALTDFVPDAAERLADYRATPPDRLVAQLRTAQAELLGEVAAVQADDLHRTGTHEVDGQVTMVDVLAFLPAHQQDHADQLTALLDR